MIVGVVPGGCGSLSINLALNGLAYLGNIFPVKISTPEEEEEEEVYILHHVEKNYRSVRVFTTTERLELPLPRTFCMGG